MGKKRDRNAAEEERKKRKERKRAKKEAKKAKKKKGAPSNETPANKEAQSTSRPTAVSPTPISHNVFHQKRLKMIVSLYPVALSNVLSHVRESLRSLLLKYSDGVGGILLGFDNVKFSEEERRGKIMNELPQVHYIVELDALVFCPEVGSKVRIVVDL